MLLVFIAMRPTLGLSAVLQSPQETVVPCFDQHLVIRRIYTGTTVTCYTVEKVIVDLKLSNYCALCVVLFSLVCLTWLAIIAVISSRDYPCYA